MLTAPQLSFLAWGLVHNKSIKSPLPLFLPPTPTCLAEGCQQLEQADDPDSFHTFPQELQQLLGPIAWQLPLVLLAAATSSSSSSGGGGSSGTRGAGDNQQTGFGLGDAALAAFHNWCRVATATHNAQHTAARAAGRLAEASALQEKMAGWVSDSIRYVLLLLQLQAALLAAAVAGVAAAVDAGQRAGAAAAGDTAIINGILPDRLGLRTETIAAILGMSNGSSVN
jgi:hypothetical protein